MRVTLDGTPLLGSRTGIGTYVDQLLRALSAARPDDDWAATAFTLRGRGALPQSVPDSVETVARPASARALHEAWQRVNFPPVEAICGPTDVFHATNYVLPPLRRAGGVLTIHDLAYLRYPHTVSSASLAYQELVPRGLRRAAALCVISQTTGQQVREAYRFPEDRTFVTPLGVDSAWFAPPALEDATRRKLTLPRDYVLAVGTLEPRKNLSALVEIWRRERDLPPLVLVGGAGWGDELNLSGIEPGRVVLTGRLGFTDLRAVVGAANLLVFPSLDEGFGLPPLEAMAGGVPVVAADIPVLREVLGDQAAFADPYDLDALTDAISTSLVKPVGTQRSRIDHAASYSWARCAERTYEAYWLAVS